MSADTISPTTVPGTHTPVPALRHAHRAFRVMGCAANVIVTSRRPNGSEAGADSLLDVAEARLRQLEAHWSRFLPDSDVTLANQAAGRPVTVHADTLAVLERAIEAWKQTRGLFDITVLPALLRHGYTHSEAVGESGHRTLAPIVRGRLIGVTGSIELDHRRGTLAIPAGAAIDLGGIGKGHAADMVARELLVAGAAGAMIEVGGDLVVRGEPACGERWTVGVADPFEPLGLIEDVALVDGAVATSGTTVRQWISPRGETLHHLIDPTTAEPSTTSLLTATVIAADGATAEAFATAAMMHDAPSALMLLERIGLAGLLVSRDRQVHRTTTLAAFAP